MVLIICVCLHAQIIRYHNVNSCYQWVIENENDFILSWFFTEFFKVSIMMIQCITFIVIKNVILTLLAYASKKGLAVPVKLLHELAKLLPR